MLLFDIGANRGDAVVAGLNKGFTKIIAIEAAPRIYKQLVSNFIYNPAVVPLKFAVSEKDEEQIEFYEAEEDGLSSMNKAWLTAEDMPYAGKPYRTVTATTITIDTLVKLYGTPDLMKIDVEGAEWSVFRGMSKNHGKLAFEWTDITVKEHESQLAYLASIGYTEYAPQFIVNHLEEPTEWFSLAYFGNDLGGWVDSHKADWEAGGWKVANLRPTADVGMCWVR
ncbi:fkbM_fam, methyltransferase, FkbM family [uncultured Caudovirales phage]|uniref:FkbM_fam, methyltransferase, FkbM family n=1 Tax=uncultured Caudovirales phage TaxID=2100421 RepID=A0A6J5PSI2_9CAUD|nr:fkbM_fam, methyltransferase, FkbM family [uncultured Caudovirales phage]CAB4179721.1 fkbM_fam, methyltransferase, FkbM family [uncultured Caudovirales phage]CAB4188837.1 fkbM_fam, methyltransferase, FkbM family [uncultured Caudovirales phage]